MRKLADICRHWKELDEVKDPVNMNLGLEQLNQRIAQLMLQKNAIIDECRKELMAADENYYRDQAKQSEDLECLVERINNHVETMKREYRNQLDHLQATIDSERTRLSQETDEAWKLLYDRQREQELLKLDNQAKQRTVDDRQLEALVLGQEELIRSTKSRLEVDNECLQLELQRTKADVLLNTQKLDYNFEVLKRREEESVRNQQKKRLTKLHDTIVEMRRTLKETDAQSVQETSRLRTDISKLKDQISELQKSATVSSRANNRKVSVACPRGSCSAIEVFLYLLSVQAMLGNEPGRMCYPGGSD